MMWKWQRADVSRNTEGDLAAALGRIKAKTYVIPINEDIFFPVRDCEAEQKMISDSELKVVETIDGHLGLFFGTDANYMVQVDKYLKELLAFEV